VAGHRYDGRMGAILSSARASAWRARCERTGCSPKQPHVILAKADGDGKQRHPRRQLTGFCDDCWQHAYLRHGRNEVPDMSFLFNAGVLKRGKRIDPGARLKGRVTDNEFRSFVDSCLKANKSPGPDGYTNESVKTMSYAELEILREWANEILAMEKARVMTVEEMNGTIRLLHKGGVTDDRPQDWRQVVLLNCTNQLVMHILNARLRSIVEKAGILEPGRSGGRQGRSTDINLTKLEWVTREALTQGKRVYRVDVDFTNAFNAMSHAALLAVMRAYGIPDVDCSCHYTSIPQSGWRPMIRSGPEENGKTSDAYMEYGLPPPGRVKPRRDGKMAEKQVHTMVKAEKVAPGSDWYIPLLTADAEVWLQENGRVHTVQKGA
jgi:hypothetical protein